MIVVTKAELKGPERLNISPSEIKTLDDAKKVIEDLLRVVKEFKVHIETTDVGEG